jgi:two-component system sensor histidine kinase VicK
MHKPNKAQQKLFADILLLERGKAESEALFLSIGDGAIVTDGNGNISRINNVALEILGYELSDVVGKWYPGTIIAETEEGEVIPYVERPIVKAFLSGESEVARLYYRRKDGSRVAVSLNVSPVLLNGVPLGAIQVFRDISEELRLEHAKDEFISLASHQLRTPATGVKQYLGMVLQGFAGDITSTQREMLAKAYESNERQLRIISDLLRVAHVDAGEVVLRRTKVGMYALVRDVIKEQTDSFELRKQTIAFKKAGREIFAYIDEDAIRMVLENILDNAGKYSPEGAKVTISVAESSDKVRVRIADQGVGIAQQDKDKIFDKFSRLDNSLSVSAGGTGIGLYWAKKIVDLHRGHISHAPGKVKGTAFTITLPKELDVNDFVG